MKGMYLGLIIACITPISQAELEPQASGYDCSRPSEIKIYDASVNCSVTQKQFLEEPSRDYVILQKVKTRKIQGFKCQVLRHRHLAYCGVWSYEKSLVDEQHETAVTVNECEKIINYKRYVIEQKKHAISVPGVTYLHTQDIGIETGKDGYPVCQGVDMQLEGEILNSVVGHSNYRVEVQQVTFVWDIESDTMTEESTGEKAACLRGQRGCEGTTHTFYWGWLKPKCQYERVKSVSFQKYKDILISEKAMLALNVSSDESLLTGTECKEIGIKATQYPEIFVTEADNREVKGLMEEIEDINVEPILGVQMELDFSQWQQQSSMENPELRQQQEICEHFGRMTTKQDFVAINPPTFGMRRGDAFLEAKCERVITTLKSTDTCYADIPLKIPDRKSVV